MGFRFIFIIAFSLFSVGAYAETFMVNASSDENNHGDSQVTLREAIALANASAGSDTIVFDSELAGTTIATSGYAIANDLIIDGSGAEGLKVRLTGVGKLLEVASGATLELSSLALTSVDVGSGSSTFAVINCGALDVSKVSFTGFSGALSLCSSDGSQSSLDNVVFENNSHSLRLFPPKLDAVSPLSSVVVSSSYFKKSPVFARSYGSSVSLDIHESLLVDGSYIHLNGAIEMNFTDSSVIDSSGELLRAFSHRERPNSYTPYTYAIPKVTIASATITRNRGYRLMNLSGAEVTMKDTTIHGNSYNDSSGPTHLISSSRVYDEDTSSYYGFLTISNSIISDNGPGTIDILLANADLDVSYSVLPALSGSGGTNTQVSLDSTTQLYQGSSVEMGNLIFSELYPPYLMPLPSSFVIGAGDASSVAGSSGVPLTDQRGSARVLDGAIDLGAIEYNRLPELDIVALREAFRDEVAALIAAETPDEDIVLDLDLFAIDADMDAVVDIRLLNVDGYAYDDGTHQLSASRNIFESQAIRVDVEDEHGLINRQELYINPPSASGVSSDSSGGSVAFLGLTTVSLLSLRRRRKALRAS
jgi:hypothetical protein